MNGWWDSENVDQFIAHIIAADIPSKINERFWLKFQLFLHKIFNFQRKTHAFKVGVKHYDIGNQFFKYMLDKRMNYTCAYWQNTKNLDEAQVKKLGLKPGMRLLDIGCGWGALGKYAAQNYGVEVVGITISKQQAELAKQLCQGLPVEIKLQDYRNITGTFDRIASLGMFEHVGYLNYRTFMQTVKNLLKDDR